MVTAEAKLLTKALLGDLSDLLKVGFDSSILIFPYNRVLDIAINYYRKYNAIPSFGALAEMCHEAGISNVPIADQSECPEHILAYWDKIKADALKSHISNTLDDIATVYNEKKKNSMEFVQYAIQELSKICSVGAYGGGITTLGDMVDPLLDDYRLAMSGKVPGIPIPEEFTYLRNSLVKLEPGHITTVVARRSVGKTWKGLILSLNGAKHSHPVLIASMEMPRLDISRRLVSLAADLDFNAIKKGLLIDSDRLKYEKFLGDMKSGRGFWDYVSIMEPREIKSVFAVENRAHSVGAELVFADAFYLYPGTRNEDERFKRIENNLSDVRAVSLDTMRHWILTAQFNRRAKGAISSDEFAVGGSDSFNQDSNNIIHMIQDSKAPIGDNHVLSDSQVSFPIRLHFKTHTQKKKKKLEKVTITVTKLNRYPDKGGFSPL